MTHPIEAESYRVLATRADLSRFPRPVGAVVARVIHATADPSYAETMVVSEDAVAGGVAALRGGAPLVADVEMVRAAISAPAYCFLGPAGAQAADGTTRSAGGVRLAAAAHPEGAVIVVGCAPTALFEVVQLAAAGALRPALVIGMPVGFVGAARAKHELRGSGLPAVSNVGEKGGSAAAAAVANAILRLAADG